MLYLKQHADFRSQIRLGQEEGGGGAVGDLKDNLQSISNSQAFSDQGRGLIPTSKSLGQLVGVTHVYIKHLTSTQITLIGG